MIAGTANASASSFLQTSLRQLDVIFQRRLALPLRRLAQLADKDQLTLKEGRQVGELDGQVRAGGKGLVAGHFAGHLLSGLGKGGNWNGLAG